MRSDPAVAYDKWHENMRQSSANRDPLTFPWYRSAYAGIKNQLQGDLLEIGCGRGEFAIWLATSHPRVRVTGMDFSPTAIAIAQKSASSAGQHVQFLVGDAQSLSLPDNSFDCVVS